MQGNNNQNDNRTSPSEGHDDNSKLNKTSLNLNGTIKSEAAGEKPSQQVYDMNNVKDMVESGPWTEVKNKNNKNKKSEDRQDSGQVPKKKKKLKLKDVDPTNPSVKLSTIEKMKKQQQEKLKNITTVMYNGKKCVPVAVEYQGMVGCKYVPYEDYVREISKPPELKAKEEAEKERKREANRQKKQRQKEKKWKNMNEEQRLQAIKSSGNAFAALAYMIDKDSMIRAPEADDDGEPQGEELELCSKEGCNKLCSPGADICDECIKKLKKEKSEEKKEDKKEDKKEEDKKEDAKNTSDDDASERSSSSSGLDSMQTGQLKSESEADSIITGRLVKEARQKPYKVKSKKEAKKPINKNNVKGDGKKDNPKNIQDNSVAKVPFTKEEVAKCQLHHPELATLLTNGKIHILFSKEGDIYYTNSPGEVQKILPSATLGDGINAFPDKWFDGDTESIYTINFNSRGPKPKIEKADNTITKKKKQNKFKEFDSAKYPSDLKQAIELIKKSGGHVKMNDFPEGIKASDFQNNYKNKDPDKGFVRKGHSWNDRQFERDPASNKIKYYLKGGEYKDDGRLQCSFCDYIQEGTHRFCAKCFMNVRDGIHRMCPRGPCHWFWNTRNQYQCSECTGVIQHFVEQTWAQCAGKKHLVPKGDINFCPYCGKDNSFKNKNNKYNNFKQYKSVEKARKEAFYVFPWTKKFICVCKTPFKKGDSVCSHCGRKIFYAKSKFEIQQAKQRLRLKNVSTDKIKEESKPKESNVSEKTCAKCGLPSGQLKYCLNCFKAGVTTPKPTWKCSKCGHVNAEPRTVCVACKFKRPDNEEDDMNVNLPPSKNIVKGYTREVPAWTEEWYLHAPTADVHKALKDDYECTIVSISRNSDFFGRVYHMADGTEVDIPTWEDFLSWGPTLVKGKCYNFYIIETRAGYAHFLTERGYKYALLNIKQYLKGDWDLSKHTKDENDRRNKFRKWLNWDGVNRNQKNDAIYIEARLAEKEKRKPRPNWMALRSWKNQSDPYYAVMHAFADNKTVTLSEEQRKQINDSFLEKKGPSKTNNKKYNKCVWCDAVKMASALCPHCFPTGKKVEYRIVHNLVFRPPSKYLYNNICPQCGYLKDYKDDDDNCLICKYLKEEANGEHDDDEEEEESSSGEELSIQFINDGAQVVDKKQKRDEDPKQRDSQPISEQSEVTFNPQKIAKKENKKEPRVQNNINTLSQPPQLDLVKQIAALASKLDELTYKLDRKDVELRTLRQELALAKSRSASKEVVEYALEHDKTINKKVRISPNSIQSSINEEEEEEDKKDEPKTGLPPKDEKDLRGLFEPQQRGDSPESTSTYKEKVKIGEVINTNTNSRNVEAKSPEFGKVGTKRDISNTNKEKIEVHNICRGKK